MAEVGANQRHANHGIYVLCKAVRCAHGGFLDVCPRLAGGRAASWGACVLCKAVRWAVTLHASWFSGCVALPLLIRTLILPPRCHHPQRADGRIRHPLQGRTHRVHAAAPRVGSRLGAAPAGAAVGFCAQALFALFCAPWRGWLCERLAASGGTPCGPPPRSSACRCGSQTKGKKSVHPPWLGGLGCEQQHRSQSVHTLFMAGWCG